MFGIQPPEDDENKSRFENIENWFDFMNQEFEESHQKGKINNLLIDNDIDLIN